MTDRDYFFWIATFTHLPEHAIDPIQTVEQLLTKAQRATPFVSFAGYEIYRDVGEVLMETDTDPVRPWEYCLLAELDVRTDLDGLLADPPAVMYEPQWHEHVQLAGVVVTDLPSRN